MPDRFPIAKRAKITITGIVNLEESVETLTVKIQSRQVDLMGALSGIIALTQIEITIPDQE